MKEISMSIHMPKCLFTNPTSASIDYLHVGWEQPLSVSFVPCHGVTDSGCQQLMILISFVMDFCHESENGQLGQLNRAAACCPNTKEFHVIGCLFPTPTSVLCKVGQVVAVESPT